MTYLDGVDACFRQQLVNNAGIRSLVGTRVYPTYLAAIKTPVYPCICFQRQTSSRDFRYSKRVSPQYEVWIYSSKNFSETDTLYELIKNIFDNEWFDIPGVVGARAGFRIIDHGSQDMDPDEALYMCNFSVQAFGFFT